MDLLYSKYSNPLEFMHIYIDQGRFGEFVQDVIEKHNKENEEKNDEILLNIWMHKCFNMGFEEFKKSSEGNQSNAHSSGSDINMDDDAINEVIKKTLHL